MRKTMLAGCAAATLLFSVGAVAIEGDVATMSCQLFLRYIGTDPSDFEIFRSWLQGYAIANRGATTPEHDENLMSSLVGYCRAHPDDTFATASEFAVKKRQD